MITLKMRCEGNRQGHIQMRRARCGRRAAGPVRRALPEGPHSSGVCRAEKFVAAPVPIYLQPSAQDACGCLLTDEP